MCGIFCYCGKKKAIPILLEGLKRLEYRGYDSAGLAVKGRGRMLVVKTSGRVVNLEKKCININNRATTGIAHTRWATHGKPTELNAHPHVDCTGKIAVIHNGIIENFSAIKKELIAEGHQFHSQTDTEVIAHLIEKYYAQRDFETAVLKAVKLLNGTFGIAVLNLDFPDKIVVVKRGSPVLLGIGDGEMFVASDSNALGPFTNKMILLNDNEIAVIQRDQYYIKNLENELLKKEIETLEKEEMAVSRQGFEHFMLKEIFEQPQTIKNAFRGRILKGEGVSKLGGLEPVIDRLISLRKLIIVSCGTSYNAGLLGRYILESLTKVEVQTEVASEFRYRRIQLGKGDVVLALSQSGETADTIAALKEARRKGALILGVVNMVGSSIAQMTDAGIYNHAGPEIGVASTKIYTSQLVIMTLIALLLGRNQSVSFMEGEEILNAIQQIPQQVKNILDQSARVEAIARKYARYKNFLYIGRLYNYPTALEAALKLKEISYIHAEGYAAGEMKHGPISLIDENFPTVSIAPTDATFDKMISNMQEIKARNGKIITVTDEQNSKIEEVSDEIIVVPKSLPILQPILNIIPLQLFAYYLARENGCNIDKPRNLAKSVTVE